MVFTPSQSLFQSHEPVSAEQLEINNKAITIAEVISFVVEETKNVTAPSNSSIPSVPTIFSTLWLRGLYSRCALLVLWMYVERMDKPVKHTIMTKHHNRLKDPKGVAPFRRLSENLKHIMKAKKMLGKKITESLI